MYFRKIIHWACLFLGLVIPISLFPQTYFFDYYSVAEGLYQSRVLDIVSDKQQYLWLGTLGGISRFNGNEFQNFTSQDGIAQNGVQSLFVDSHGTVWMGHLGGGLSRYYKNKLETVYASGIQIKSDITDIVEDKKRRIWVSTHGSGTFCIDNPKAIVQKLSFHQFKGNVLSDRVFGTCLGRDGSLYFISDVGIRRLNFSSDTFEKYEPAGLTKYFAKTCMFEDSKGNKWFGTYHGGLYKLDKTSSTFKIFDIRDGLASNWITSISEDAQGNIWLGSWGYGISCIRNDGKIKVYNDKNGLKDNKIRCINTDLEGNIILGTNEHGFCIFKGEQFVAYTEKDGMSQPQVFAINQDANGRFWFGTDNGITILDIPDVSKNKVTVYNQSNKTIGNQIRFILKDSRQNFWIGSLDQGIFMYDYKYERFVYDAVLNSYISGGSVVTAMAIDRKNNLWIGKTEGLLKYNIETHNLSGFSQADGLLGNEISALYVDSKDRIWVGVKGKGLSLIQDTTVRSIHLQQGTNPTYITEDSTGKIWIGTMGQGLIVVDNEKIVKTYTESDGLLANLINLLVVRDRSIYIGTNKGLNALNTSTNRIYTFTYKNGFTGIETKNNAVFCDRSNHLWFGTVQGAIEYNPESFVKNEEEPLTFITQLKVNNRDVDLNKDIRLNYKDNSIAINYQSISYSNPDAIRYQTIMLGIDTDWLPATQQRSRNFSALSPGHYIFKVRAVNSYGKWNEEPIMLKIFIKPPFYKTWWFIIGCIILGLASIIVFIKLREKKLIAEKRILELKVQERTQEVTRKNEELAEKNKNITDSIRYAKRIQLAILPSELPFSDTFILFKPKDIVSGDFYWLHKDDNYEFLAAVDCTGHGVPGAFMSIIGHVLLNKIVKEYRIFEPSGILYKLNQELSETFHSQGETSNVADGMDMALFCYEPSAHRLTYAGAFNPLILIRNGELTELPANRFSIGRNTGPDMKFESHQIEIQKNDAVFLSSDGYEDQFGGPDGKKFKAQIDCTSCLLKLLI